MFIAKHPIRYLVFIIIIMNVLGNDNQYLSIREIQFNYAIKIYWKWQSVSTHSRNII